MQIDPGEYQCMHNDILPSRSGLANHHTSQHMEKMEAGLKGLCIQEMMLE